MKMEKNYFLLLQGLNVAKLSSTLSMFLGNLICCEVNKIFGGVLHNIVFCMFEV